jgi:uncharacterized iron-regulated protein
MTNNYLPLFLKLKTVRMKFNFIFIFLICSWFQNSMGQDKKPYQIYTFSGQEAGFKEMLKAAEKAEVVLFGEQHDNAIVHWLQLEFIKELHTQFAAKKSLILGAEMIEADNQKQLNQYLKNEINQKQLDSTARLWKNYKTDYKPLVDFAKTKNIPFIATNVPRKFASMVYKNGFESLDLLSQDDKNWIAPLPILYDPKLPGYVKMIAEMQGHGGENLPKAQALKDATMAHFILKNLTEKATFIHFNGTYHSEYQEGIVWYLKQKKPKLKTLTIASVTQNDIIRLDKEHINKADFIIVVDEDVTKTY